MIYSPLKTGNLDLFIKVRNVLYLNFQSFLSIDCGKTAQMILTEFPDILTSVIRQLEVSVLNFQLWPQAAQAPAVR